MHVQVRRRRKPNPKPEQRGEQKTSDMAICHSPFTILLNLEPQSCSALSSQFSVNSQCSARRQERSTGNETDTYNMQTGTADKHCYLLEHTHTHTQASTPQSRQQRQDRITPNLSLSPFSRRRKSTSATQHSVNTHT